MWNDINDDERFENVHVDMTASVRGDDDHRYVPCQRFADTSATGGCRALGEPKGGVDGCDALHCLFQHGIAPHDHGAQNDHVLIQAH